MHRREFLKLVGAASVGLATGSPSVIEAATRGGCLWGANAQPRGSQTGRTAITALEKMIDRRLAISRHYVMWDHPLPDTFQEWTVKRGRTPYISWNAAREEGTMVPWASIAAGAEDRLITSRARSLRAWGHPVFLTFHHEPEIRTGWGTPADYAAAFERIRGIFASARVRNARWVVTLLAGTYEGANGGPEAWMPSQFRLCGVDGYNRYPCSGQSWRSFANIFAPAQRFARSIGKNLFVGEYGCVENPGNPSAKARWFRAAGDAIRSWNNVTGVLYSHVFDEPFGCAYWVDTSPKSLAAFKAVGNRSYFS
jgi:hypothetical protein